MSKSAGTTASESVRRTFSTLSDIIPLLDPRILQSTVDEVLTTLNEPEFREEVKKTVELSYTTSLQILQRFSKMSREMPTTNREKMAESLKESVPELVKTNLSMAIELLTLNQKYSSMLLDILEKSGKTTKKNSNNDGEEVREAPVSEQKARRTRDVRPRRR
jgi:hypothetical protein